jgi:hypothetical protein
MENKNYGFIKYLNETVVNPGFNYEGSDDGKVIISTKATSGEPVQILRTVAFQLSMALRGQAKFMFDYDDETGEDVTKDKYKTRKIFSELDYAKTAAGKDLKDMNVMSFKANKFIVGFKKKDKKWVEEASKTLVDAAQDRANEDKARYQRQKEYQNSKEYKAAENKYKSETAKAKKAELLKKWPADVLKRVSARKYMGDDMYSWAVFIDGKPFVTGLGNSQVDYYKRQAYGVLTKHPNDPEKFTK